MQGLTALHAVHYQTNINKIKNASQLGKTTYIFVTHAYY